MVHVGLGDAERVDQLTITWPSGEVQTLKQIPVGQHLRITEGEETPEVLRQHSKPLDPVGG